MPTIFRLAVASIAAASLVGAAAGAAAEPGSTPVADAEAGTGSSAVDSGSAAAQSVGVLAGRGDIIGVIVLLGITPIQMLTSGICDLATMSALPSPCSPGRAHYTEGTPAAK